VLARRAEREVGGSNQQLQATRAVHCWGKGQGGRGPGRCKGRLGGSKWRKEGLEAAGQGRGWEVRESVEFFKWVLGSSHHHNARGYQCGAVGEHTGKVRGPGTENSQRGAIQGTWSIKF